MASKLRSFAHFSNFLARGSPVKPRELVTSTQRLSATRRDFVSSAKTGSGKGNATRIALVVGGLGFAGGVYGYLAAPDRTPRQIKLTEKHFDEYAEVPDIQPSRVMGGPATDFGLGLQLYQYQNCPFCCKVRTFLDFYGIPYGVVEVNPVMRQQLKFSHYKKVPILIATEKESGRKYQLNDSTVIVSILGTLLSDLGSGLQSVLKLYVPYSYTDEDGKQMEEVINRYFLMQGDKGQAKKSEDYLKQEREWRKWADQELVHILSPNIYRTYEESIQAFKHFSEVGQWEANFSTLERIVVIYVGATAMYFVGKRLKKKYMLKEDVRESLYDACKKWTKAVGNQRTFMGGDLPNLADLTVYGFLSSIEGCQAFQDLLESTNIGKWYFSVKEAVSSHQGYHTLKI